MGTLESAAKALREHFDSTGRKLLGSLPDPENRRLELDYSPDWGFRVNARPIEPDSDRDTESESISTKLVMALLRAAVNPE